MGVAKRSPCDEGKGNGKGKRKRKGKRETFILLLPISMFRIRRFAVIPCRWIVIKFVCPHPRLVVDVGGEGPPTPGVYSIETRRDKCRKDRRVCAHTYGRATSQMQGRKPRGLSDIIYRMKRNNWSGSKSLFFAARFNGEKWRSLVWRAGLSLSLSFSLPLTLGKWFRWNVTAVCA